MKDIVDSVVAGSRPLSVRRFEGFDDAGRPLIAGPPDDPAPVPALTLVDLVPGQAGAEVAVAWVDDDPARPLILGLVRAPARVAEADGERVVIEGRREVVLRCGKASITLTPDGGITLRGGRILSRADGANRVQGASVQLN